MLALASHPALFHFSNTTDDADDIEEYEETLRLTQPSRATKISGACIHCKRSKVRCEFSPGQITCRRCQALKQPCRARSRKKRKAAPTHEDLQEKAHNQDLQIQALLSQFDKLRADERIKDWMIRARSAGVHGTVTRPFWTSKRFAEASAIPDFFVGSNVSSPPDIVKYCSLSPEEIEDLFAIFFKRVNSFFSILDPTLHTSRKLMWTSPFLFTVICAVASRYYAEKPDLYLLAMGFARDAAGRALIDSSKSVDVCQAYLLMAVYPVPKKKWSDDRSWLFMGLAIQMAMELELDRPPPVSCNEREQLNRMRTWLNCYCVDGSHAIQFGKMPMLRLDDYLARHSRQWYKSSPMNLAFDVHLTAYVHIITIVAKWRSDTTEVPNNMLPNDFDVIASAVETQEKLSQELSLWLEAYEEEDSLHPDPICTYRGYTTRLITSYLRLAVLAVGFQQIAKVGLSRKSELVSKSIQAAREVIHLMVDCLFPMGNLRFAMEATFLYVSFAAAFLVNLLRTKFLPFLVENNLSQEEIIQDVEGLIKVLGSKDVVLDGRHTPALYSRFLSSLLVKHNRRPPSSGLDSLTNGPEVYPQHSSDYLNTPPDSWPTTWPDVVPYGDPGQIQEQRYEAYMDFSFAHFVRTVTQGYPVQIPEAELGYAENIDWTWNELHVNDLWNY